MEQEQAGERTDGKGAVESAQWIWKREEVVVQGGIILIETESLSVLACVAFHLHQRMALQTRKCGIVITESALELEF